MLSLLDAKPFDGGIGRPFHLAVRPVGVHGLLFQYVVNDGSIQRRSARA
jgi:hypothetical protein